MIDILIILTVVKVLSINKCQTTSIFTVVRKWRGNKSKHIMDKCIEMIISAIFPIVSFFNFASPLQILPFSCILPSTVHAFSHLILPASVTVPFSQRRKPGSE